MPFTVTGTEIAYGVRYGVACLHRGNRGTRSTTIRAHKPVMRRARRGVSVLLSPTR